LQEYRVIKTSTEDIKKLGAYVLLYLEMLLRWHLCMELLWCKTKHKNGNEKIFNIISLDVVTPIVGLINYIAKTPNLDLHNLPFIVWLYGDICS
jgi:hypothetical protein